MLCQGWTDLHQVLVWLCALYWLKYSIWLQQQDLLLISPSWMLVSWVFDKFTLILVQTLKPPLLCHLWLRNFSWEEHQLSISVWQHSKSTSPYSSQVFSFHQRSTLLLLHQPWKYFSVFPLSTLLYVILSVSLHWRLIHNGSEWCGTTQ